MHTKRVSSMPLAIESCHCDSKKNHLAGEELHLVRPNWRALTRCIRMTDKDREELKAANA